MDSIVEKCYSNPKRQIFIEIAIGGEFVEIHDESSDSKQNLEIGLTNMEATVRKFDELAVNLFDASMFFSKEKFVDFRSDFEHSCHFYGPFSNKG